MGGNRASLRPLALAAIVGAAQAKFSSGSFHLDAGDFEHGPEYEIAKFSFLEGMAHINGKVRYKTADSNWMTSPALYLFNDDAWDAYHAAPACEDKVQHAHSLIQIGKVGNTPRMANGRREIGVPPQVLARSHPAITDLTYEQDEAIWSFKWELESTERPHGWFVIAADCALEQYNAKVSDMQYELTMLNPGDSHLPADEFGLPTVYYLAWLVMVGVGGYCLTLVKKHLAETRQKIHLVVKLLMSAWVLQFVSLTCEIIHLWRFMSNGYGSFFMDFLSELSEGLASLVISFVLICLACGWTLVETEADERKTNSVATLLRDPRAMFKGSNVGVAVCLLFIVGNTMLVFWNKASDDTFAKFHDHESSAGRTLVAIRSILGVVYLVSIVMTIKSQEARGGSEVLLGFLKKLLVFGGVWFLCFPLLVFSAGFFWHCALAHDRPSFLRGHLFDRAADRAAFAAADQRHRIVAGGVLLTQTVCLGLLAQQFLGETSTYSRLSTAWESGLLPGLGGAVTVEKGMRD